MEMMRSAPDVLTAKRQITAYFDALRENNIRVSLLVGDESWVDNEQAMQDALFPLFRLQLGFNGFVLNLGAQPDQVNLTPFEDFIRGNSGYTDIATISANELSIVQNPETIVAFVDNAITARQPGVTLVIPDFILAQQSLDAIPSPSSDELIVRARQVSEETLEYFALVGHTNLSRSEQTLMDFSQVRTLPPIQLGEAAAFVQQVTPENIFVEQGETPYITFDVTYDGNRSVATFTSIVRLTSITTGETIEDTFPIHMSLEPGFRTQRINIPIAELAPGQWRYDVTVIPSTYERGIDFRPATPLLPEGSTVQAGSQDITVFLSNREGTERRVEVGGNEFFLLSPPNAQPGVRIGDEFFPLPEIRTEGVRFELGPSNIRVNVSQNPFGEWAIETGGEEVTITAMQTGEEALMIGIPQHARTSGFIQQGLPEISVTNVDIDVTSPFIFQQESTVIPVQFDTSFLAGDYGVLLTLDDAGMIEVQLTAPDGEITRRSFPVSSSERVFTVGNRLLILGTNADNELVAVVAPFASSTISFEVSNSIDATSPARYIPEVSFYHPVVGELSISADMDYVIQPGETRTITMDLPIPVDFLANEKLELSVIRNEIRAMQSSYADFITEQQRLQGLESIPADRIEAQIQQRFETLRDTLPGYIQTVQSLIRQVQAQNMISETHQAAIVNLQGRLTALDELLARIDTVSPDEFSFLLTDIVIEFQNVRTAFSDLSTQLYGYRVSIHDVSNLLGEPVYAHFTPLGQDTGVQAPVPVIRDVVIDPVLGRTEQQIVRRIGKAPYAQIVLGVVTPAVIQETHQAYVANYLDLRQSQLQLASLVHDYYRVLEYNIPSSQFAVDNAQLNIELASSERDRSQTVDLTGVFFENINLLKTADIRGGEAHILHYAEIVQEGETLIYDASTEILASLLADLDADISLAPRADAVRFLEDLVSLFGLLDEDITTDEALLHVNNFLVGANSTDIQRAENIVRAAMQDGRLEGRQRAAFIISQIVTEPSVREYLLHLSFSRMADQLDEDQTQAEQITNPADRERELARIRGLRAYMGLVIERNAAEDLLEQARTNHQLGIDPTAQAASARLAFQRALGHFQIIIGLETEFRAVTDLNDLIERIQASSLNPEDKQHAVETLQQITENLQEFQQFLSRRQQAIDGAEQSLADRQTDVQEANDLLTHLSELRAGHELFIERLDRSVGDQTTRWQNAIRQIPPDQALPFIEEVIQLESNNLTSSIRDLQRAHQNQEFYQGIIDSNTEQITELRQRHSASASQVERQIIIASRIRDLELSSLEASAELEFLAWHIPYLETQITGISERITELQGAQLVLGGTPDTDIFNGQISSITTQLSPLQNEATSLDATIAGLSSYQSELESDYQTLLDRYNYPQRMRAVGEQIELSTSLTELNLINNPDSYFQFLKYNGISHVYIPTSEITDAQGNIDIGRLTYAGRIIQAAQQNDIRVSITLTIDFDWQEGELGGFDVDAAAELFRLFQQQLFQYNVRINGFAVQLTPYTGTTPPSESAMDAYRDARQDIAETISEESDDLLDAIRNIITAERDAGRFDTADAMEQTLSQMLGSQGTLTYTFEVFETQQLASSIEHDLQTRFGADASAHRSEEYPGTSIIRSVSSSVSHIRGIDSHLQTTPHGIGIDWSTSTAQGQQERLPELIESIHTYAQTQPGGLSSIFIESDNVYALQRNLNALGAVPLYALDLLQTEADLQTAYNQRVLSYVQGLNGQLENLRNVLDAEQEFRDSSQGLIDEIGRIPDEGLVLEMPDFLLGDDVQLSQLQQRLSDLETRINLRMTMEEADALAADIDQLYEDMSANIRRLRISLSALFTPSGFQIPGITGINSFGQAQSLFSGSSTISFDFGQLLPSGSPVGFSISYRTSDGRQEQRDFLREHENLLTSVTHLRDAAYQFAEFSAQIDAMGLQLQRDYTDVAMLRRGIDLASRPEAQTTPHTFVIGGQEIIIQGNIIVALRDVSTALESATTRESTLEREITSLENTITALRNLRDQAPAPDTSATFLTRDIQPQESIVSLDYAVTNRDLAQAQYEQAVRGNTVAQTEYGRALDGLQDARTSIQTAANNINLAQNAVEESREQVEQAFLDLLTALAGTNITRDQLYDTQVGGIGVRLRLDQAETGLQQAYFNFDTLFHRIFNLIESTSTEAQFEAYFRGYETDRILPGWGLDAVLGPGAPFTGNRDIEAATTAQVVSSVLQPPVSLSLYGGFINLSLTYTSPNFINIGLNLSSAGNSRIGQAELNLLNRQSQFILTNMAEADRREQVEQAVAHFEAMMENYNESLRMLEWRQTNLEQAGLRLESVVTDWEQARDFLHSNTRELELAQQNLEQRQQNMISARQTVEEIERAANDEITRDEMQGEMVHQTPPEIIPESESTTITTPDPNRGEEFERARILNQALARIFYAFLAWLFLLFGKDSIRRIIRKRSLSKINKEKQMGKENIRQNRVQSLSPTGPATHFYTKNKIDRIFRDFTPESPEELKTFLAYFAKNPRALPTQVSLFSNPVFKAVRQFEQSPQHVFEALSQIGDQSQLSIAEVLQLQTILEKTNFVNSLSLSGDIIVLDFDTLGLSSIENAANEEHRRMLLYYLESLEARFAELGRTPRIVIFSESRPSWELPSVLGPILSAHIMQFYGIELFDSFEQSRENRYYAFFATVATHYDVNRVNLKVFSNRQDIMNSAQSAGTILANREGTVFDALTIFANLHPNHIANLLIKGTDISTETFIQDNTEGYLSFAGKELQLRQPAPGRLRTIIPQNLIDSAA
ncbi:MAG: hypothetical protein H7A34_03855 [bacterium]|nr:hypothetical protein [bacterium]